MPVYQIADSLQQEIKYETALLCYLNEDFETAHSQMQQLLYFSKDQKISDKILLLDILIDHERFEYASAREKTIRWLTPKSMSQGQRDSLLILVEEAYDPANLPRLARKKKAAWLSTFIPGSGQMYAGFPGEGLMNTFFVIASLATGTYAVLETYYFTGYLLGAGLFQKFYFGGLRRTESLVDKGNYLRTRPINDRLRTLLISVAESQ